MIPPALHPEVSFQLRGGHLRGRPDAGEEGAKTLFGAEILNFGGRASPAIPNHCPGRVALTGGRVPCPVPPPALRPVPRFLPAASAPRTWKGRSQAVSWKPRSLFPLES